MDILTTHPVYNNYTRRFSTWVGIVCVLVGLAVNKWSIAFAVVADGAIEDGSSNFIIFLFEASFIAFGGYLLIKRPAIKVFDALLLTSSVVFNLLLAILFFQIFYMPPAIVSGWRGLRGSALEHNELGYRGRPISYSNDDFVILLVGDSQLEASACAYDYIPERRLEQYLQVQGKHVKVFSVGAAGYGQDQELLAVEEYYKNNYRADEVVLWESPENDIWNNIFPTHWPTNANPKPTFWLEDGILYGPTEQIGDSLPHPVLKLISLFPKFIPSIAYRDTLWEKRLPPAYKPLNEYTGVIDHDWQRRWDLNFGTMRGENLAIEKSHYAIQLTPRSQRMDYGVQLTHKLLQKIAADVAVHQGTFETLVVNDGWLFTDKPAKDETVYGLNGKYYPTSIRQFDQNVADLNADLKTLRLNVAVANSRVGPTDLHLNEHATDEVMLKLADLIGQDIPKSRFGLTTTVNPSSQPVQHKNARRRQSSKTSPSQRVAPVHKTRYRPNVITRAPAPNLSNFR
jgi:hypothetical protein